MEGDYKVVRDKYSEENMVLNLAAETIQQAYRRYQECKPLKRIRRINSEGKLAIRLAGTTIASNIKRAFINKKRLASSKLTSNKIVEESTALVDLLPSTKYPNLWLTIYSIDTKGLPSVKWRGDNDPYAEISLGSWISTTSTLWGGGKNCSWKNLNLTSKLKETTDSGDTISITDLNIKIFNANLAREDQIIGEAKHSLSHLKLLEKTTLLITLYDDLSKHENRRRSAGSVSLEVFLQAELDSPVPDNHLSAHSIPNDSNSDLINNYDEFYKEKDISVKKITTYLSQPLPPAHNVINHPNLSTLNTAKVSQTLPVPAPVSEHKKTATYPHQRSSTPENKSNTSNGNQITDAAATKKSVTIASTISTAAKEKDRINLTSSDRYSDTKPSRNNNINPKSATVTLPIPSKEIQNNNLDNTFITSKKTMSALSVSTANKYPPDTSSQNNNTTATSVRSSSSTNHRNHSNTYSSSNASTTSDSRNSYTNNSNGNSNSNSNRKSVTSDTSKEELIKVQPNSKNSAIAGDKLSIAVSSSESKNNNNNRHSPVEVDEGNESDKIIDRKKKKKLKKKRPASSAGGMPPSPPHQLALNVSLKSRYLSSVEARQIDLAMLHSMESEACTLYLRAKDVSKILKALKYVVREDTVDDVASSTWMLHGHSREDDVAYDDKAADSPPGSQSGAVRGTDVELLLRSFRSPALLAASLSSFARQHHLTNQPDFSVSETKASIAVLHLLTLVEGPWKKARGLIMTACEAKGKAGEAKGKAGEAGGGRPSFWDAKWISRLMKTLDYSTTNISNTNGQEFLKIDFMSDTSTYFDQPLPSIRRTTLLVYQHLLRVVEQRWDQGVRPSDLLVTDRGGSSTGGGAEEKASSRTASNKEQTMSSSIPGRVASPLKYDTFDRNETAKVFREGDLIQIAAEDELLSAWQPYNRAYGWGISIEQLALLCSAIEGVTARLVARPYACSTEDTTGLQWVVIRDSSDTTTATAATALLRDYQGRDFVSGRNILIPVTCMRTPRRASLPGQPAEPKYTPLSTVPPDKVAVGMTVMIAPIPLLLRVCERFDWWDRPVNKTLELISSKEGRIISISELASRRRIGVRVDSVGIADALPVEAVALLSSALRNSPPARSHQRPVSATGAAKKSAEDNTTANITNNTRSQVYKSVKSSVGNNAGSSKTATATSAEEAPCNYLMQGCGGGDEAANPNCDDDGNVVEESKAYRTASSLNGYGSDRSLQSVTVSAPVVTVKAAKNPSQSTTGVPNPSGRRPLYRPVSAAASTAAADKKSSSTNLSRSLNTYAWLNPNQPINFDNIDKEEEKGTEKVTQPVIVPKHSPKKRMNVPSQTPSSTPWLSVRQAEFDSENAQYQRFETTADDRSGGGKRTPGKLKTGSVHAKPKSPIDRLHSRNLQSLSHNTKKSRLFTDSVRGAAQHVAESKQSEGRQDKEAAEEDRGDVKLGMGVVGSRVGGGPGAGATDEDLPAAKKTPKVRPLSATSTKTAPQTLNRSAGNKPAFGGSIPTRPLSASATRRRDAAMNSLGNKLAFLDIGNEEAMEVTRQQRLERELRRTQRDTNAKEKYLKRQLKKYGVDSKAYDSYSIV